MAKSVTYNKSFLQEIHLMDLPDEYIIFDLETNVLDYGEQEIVEIGAVRVKDHQIVEEFDQLVTNFQPLAWFTTNLTGITQSMINTHGVGPEEALNAFLEFVQDLPLVGHNIWSFDLTIVSQYLEVYHLGLLKNQWLDTVKESRRLLPNLESHKLQALADYYGVDYTGAHRAADDSRITFYVLEHLLQEAQNSEYYQYLHHDALRQYPQFNQQLLLKKHSAIEYFQNRKIMVKGEMACFGKDALSHVLKHSECKVSFRWCKSYDLLIVPDPIFRVLTGENTSPDERARFGREAWVEKAMREMQEGKLEVLSESQLFSILHLRHPKV